MANSFKNTWWIFILIAAGAILLFLGLQPHKSRDDQGLVLNDIFHPKINPVAPMAIVASPVNGHKAPFTIQVFSFQDKNRAEGVLQALTNKGYHAFLIISDLGQKRVWYRLRVDGIGDEAAARKMLEEIRKDYNSGFILKPAK